MEPKNKPTLADVDGSVPGKVQLVAIKLVDGFGEDPKMTHTYFEEDGNSDRDPWLMAEGLKRGIEDDWPEHHWAIVGNWRARYLKWVRYQKALGFLPEDAWSPAAYLDVI